MRGTLWAVRIGLCLAVGLLYAESGKAQTGIFPIGRPYNLASGFSGPVVNAPINTGSVNLSNSVLPILPQQNVGMMMPNFRNLMLMPNHNTVTGVSPLPTPAQMKEGSFFDNLNPFKK